MTFTDFRKARDAQERLERNGQEEQNADLVRNATAEARIFMQGEMGSGSNTFSLEFHKCLTLIPPLGSVRADRAVVWFRVHSPSGENTEVMVEMREAYDGELHGKFVSGGITRRRLSSRKAARRLDKAA